MVFNLFLRLNLHLRCGAVTHGGAAAFSTNWPWGHCILTGLFMALNPYVTSKIAVQQLISRA
jgi:hypothetical protein